MTPVTHWVGPGPSYVLNAIEEAMNIDANTDNYLELMQKEIAAAIPRNLTVDKRNLYKNITDFYKLKGSSDSNISRGRVAKWRHTLSTEDLPDIIAKSTSFLTMDSFLRFFFSVMLSGKNIII